METDVHDSICTDQTKAHANLRLELSKREVVQKWQKYYTITEDLNTPIETIKDTEFPIAKGVGREWLEASNRLKPASIFSLSRKGCRVNEELDLQESTHLQSPKRKKKLFAFIEKRGIIYSFYMNILFR